ncbi:hypothetical protein DFP72DRAFT_855554 [Ephemerocybe angulata]|uniref:Uncharacterized protein n=1 Tax=Ephemerocybe angulata TaxID=980116 RepID=A0A8H6HGB9_9AGAR|nr:hypothetical protein DFP72DRAFT_855554 [Tulosesus angulatus]
MRSSDREEEDPEYLDLAANTAIEPSGRNLALTLHIRRALGLPLEAGTLQVGLYSLETVHEGESVIRVTLHYALNHIARQLCRYLVGSLTPRPKGITSTIAMRRENGDLSGAYALQAGQSTTVQRSTGKCTQIRFAPKISVSSVVRPKRRRYMLESPETTVRRIWKLCEGMRVKQEPTKGDVFDVAPSNVKAALQMCILCQLSALRQLPSAHSHRITMKKLSRYRCYVVTTGMLFKLSMKEMIQLNGTTELVATDLLDGDQNQEYVLTRSCSRSRLSSGSDDEGEFLALGRVGIIVPDYSRESSAQGTRTKAHALYPSAARVKPADMPPPAVNIQENDPTPVQPLLTESEPEAAVPSVVPTEHFQGDIMWGDIDNLLRLDALLNTEGLTCQEEAVIVENTPFYPLSSEHYPWTYERVSEVSTDGQRHRDIFGEWSFEDLGSEVANQRIEVKLYQVISRSKEKMQRSSLSKDIRRNWKNETNLSEYAASSQDGNRKPQQVKSVELRVNIISATGNSLPQPQGLIDRRGALKLCNFSSQTHILISVQSDKLKGMRFILPFTQPFSYHKRNTIAIAASGNEHIVSDRSGRLLSFYKAWNRHSRRLQIDILLDCDQMRVRSQRSGVSTTIYSILVGAALRSKHDMASTSEATGLNWTDAVNFVVPEPKYNKLTHTVHLFPRNNLLHLDGKPLIVLPDVTSGYKPVEYGVGVSSAEASGEEGVTLLIKSQWELKTHAKVTVAHNSSGQGNSAVVLLSTKGTDTSDGYTTYEARFPNPISMGYSGSSKLELALDIEDVAYATLSALDLAMGYADAPPSAYSVVLVLNNHHATTSDVIETSGEPNSSTSQTSTSPGNATEQYTATGESTSGHMVSVHRSNETESLLEGELRMASTVPSVIESSSTVNAISHSSSLVVRRSPLQDGAQVSGYQATNGGQSHAIEGTPSVDWMGSISTPVRAEAEMNYIQSQHRVDGIRRIRYTSEVSGPGAGRRTRPSAPYTLRTNAFTCLPMAPGDVAAPSTGQNYRTQYSDVEEIAGHSQWLEHRRIPTQPAFSAAHYTTTQYAWPYEIPRRSHQRMRIWWLLVTIVTTEKSCAKESISIQSTAYKDKTKALQKG